MKRKLQRKWNKITRNQKLIILSVISIMFITVGYSVMQNVFRIHGYARIDTGDGMIFTKIDVKENNNGIIDVIPNIKVKTMVNSTVSFAGEGSVTFTVAAQNQGEYDAKLLEIQKLNNLNGQEPQCIQTTVTNHNVGETVYAKAIKTFEVTVTSTCTEYSTKEIEIYFKYKKQETQGGVLPTPPGNGNAVEYLKNNKLEPDVPAGGNGLVAIDNTGGVTTSSTPREYRYIGSNPDNYVSFNNELWRIIGIFDGQLKLIRANVLDTQMAWDRNNINDWSTSTLQTYLNGEYLNSIDNTSKRYISNYTWKLGGSSTYNNVTAEMFYERERGETVYTGRPIEWSGKLALMYPSDYGFATSGGSTTNRSSCLAKELYSWGESSISDCKNNNWLYDSSYYQWTLTTITTNAFYGFYLYSSGYIDGTQTVHNLYIIRPSLFLHSNVEFIGGTGTESEPYQLDMKPTASEYLIDNKVEGNVDTGGNGLVAVDNTGEVTTSESPREYRYIGQNPDNYVSFNNELWRIIGIFDGQLKLIRANDLDTKMAWDTNNSNNWSQASLKTYLNGDYYNSVDASSKSMISSITWNLGGHDSHGLTAQQFYEKERGTNVYPGNPTKWIGNIALMYPSDFGFATSGGSTTNRSSCLATALWNLGNDCYSNNWLNSSLPAWLLTTQTNVSNYVFFLQNAVYSSGYAPNFGATKEVIVKPVLYLKADVERVSGSGTSADPYILDL